MKEPANLRPGQVWVVRAEVATGIVLAQNGERFLSTGPPPCHIFDSAEEARAFCLRQLSEAPEVECILFHSAGRTEIFRA
ncbi:hypothetical protein [Stigmatella hybrida]|uniref:hypothetical protein n=1 Tax=Stigmatella hybrida TaxID=394097 RepID=UPI001CDA7709|nr:hypothetical protein [Stigmatella hybrida]